MRITKVAFVALVSLLLALTLLFSACGQVSDSTSGAPATTTENAQRPDGALDSEHADSDNNGTCDDCGISVLVTFDFYALNDLHGKIDDGSSHPGVDELTTYLKNACETDDNTVLLSSGDMWQGSSESNLTKGHIVTEWMNALDFVSMTMGNHEYDWGEDFIESNAELAEFPFLAINIYDKTTNRRVSYCDASVTVEKNGVKIGIIGAIGDCYSSIASDKVEDVKFITGKALAELVKTESDKLRSEGADYIVYSIHDGFGSSSGGVSSVATGQISSYYDITLSQYGYVDLVFEGHTHQSYVLKDAYGVYHLQNGGDNKGISHVETVINFANGNSTLNIAEFVSTSVYSSFEDDPVVDTLLEKYADAIAKGSQVAGMNDVYRSGNYLRRLMAQLYCDAGVAIWGDEYDIVLGGGYLNVRSPGYLAAGKITYADLQTIFPFDNHLVLCSIKGSDLLSRFIHNNNSNYFIGFSEYGNSIKDDIDSSATYYVVVDSYSSIYAPNRLTEVLRYEKEIFARDLLFAYMQEGGLGSASAEITLTPIDEIYALGNALSDNETTEKGYYVKGKVISITNTTYGNLTIEDESGNALYIYGVYDATGTVRFDGLETAPKVGDTVTLHGPIQKYVYGSSVTVELYHARLISTEA